MVLRGLFMVSVFYGTVKTAKFAWALGDIGVGIMAWLNIIAILLLQKPALKALKDYQRQRKLGKNHQMEFHPAALGIKNADVWEQVNVAEKEPALA